MTKPVLLLDVDGVLAPFGAGPDKLHTHAEHSVDAISVWLHRDLKDMMQRLVQSFALIWGTMWENRANEHLLEPMGLEDPLEFIEFWRAVPGVEQHMNHVTYTDKSIQSWKLPWIREWARQDGRPCVWIDDEALEDATEWAVKRTEGGIPALVIRTNPALGFIDEHLEELEAWAEKVTAEQKTA